MRRTSFLPVITAASAVVLGLVLPATAASAHVPAAAPSGTTVAGAPAAVGAVTIRPRFTTKPGSPYKAGKRITVNYAGFPANITVLIAVCKAGTDLGRSAEAIGDCAPFAGKSSEFGRTNAAGSGTGKVTVLKGKLNATNFPGFKCGTTRSKRCVLVVSDLSAKYVAKKTIKYKS